MLALALVASLAVAGAAQAHNLTAKTAKRGSNAVARDFAQAFADQGDENVSYGTGKCSRRTAHKWVCRFYVGGIDEGGEYLCRGYAIVRFRSATSRTVIAKSQSRRLACVR